MLLFGKTVYNQIPAIACKSLLFILKQKQEKTNTSTIWFQMNVLQVSCSNNDKKQNQMNQPRQPIIASKQLFFFCVYSTCTLSM